MVLLAAFGTLMRRYSDVSDLLVSVPVTNRKPAAENALGYFGNTLLLRLTPTGHRTFTSLVDDVRETCLDGFARQSVGIDRVIREANPSRSSGRDGSDHVRLGFSMRKDASGLTLTTSRQPNWSWVPTVRRFRWLWQWYLTLGSSNSNTTPTFSVPRSSTRCSPTTFGCWRAR